MQKKKVFYSIINSYFFDKKYSEDEIIKVCGMVNSAMHLVHPTCKIAIRYEKANRKNHITHQRFGKKIERS